MKSSGTSQRMSVFATAGSVVSAIASSACCWLPLVLIAFGASAIGVASFFEKYRPVFLALASVLLATGFYFNYFRKERCAPGSSCAVPRPRLRRFNRITLWVATVFVVSFAFFPNYVGILIGNPQPPSAHTLSDEVQTLELTIAGMTCEGCASTLTKALSAIPGVVSARVSYKEKLAVVAMDRSTAVDTTTLNEAVKKAGYSILSIHHKESQ